VPLRACLLPREGKYVSPYMTYAPCLSEGGAVVRCRYLLPVLLNGVREGTRPASVVARSRVPGAWRASPAPGLSAAIPARLELLGIEGRPRAEWWWGRVWWGGEAA